jgi:hypothetical protein
MKFPSRLVFSVVVALALPAVAACGHKIGDSCSFASDCSPEGDRICDSSSPDGYCTIPGCDVGTCPQDSVCIQFFPVLNLDKTCAGPQDCSIDEICTVGGKCAQRSSEVRFCMALCGGEGDCRDGYECRDQPRQGAHGGQPVPGEEAASKFCAASLPCTTNDDCDLGDTCNNDTGRCQP